MLGLRRQATDDEDTSEGPSRPFFTSESEFFASSETEAGRIVFCSVCHHRCQQCMSRIVQAHHKSQENGSF